MRKHLLSELALTALFLVVAGPALAQGTAPVATAIIISLTDACSSKTAKVGQKVDGSVAENVVAGGKTVVPKGSKAVLAVASAKPSGRLKGQAKLWLKIESITVRGTAYTVDSNSSGQTGPSHNKRNVIAIGGGAAAGAVIGGMAGGGAGAAIGAGVGAAAGTGVAAMTGKKDISYPSETKLRFTLKTPLTVR